MVSRNTSAEEFSANAKSVFEELMEKNKENILEGEENYRINALIYSIKYCDNSGFLIKEIKVRIVNMIMISEKFIRDMDEAARSYKTESSKGNSSNKEKSPKKHSLEENNSSKAEGSKINKKDVLKIQKALEKLEDQDMKK